MTAIMSPGMAARWVDHPALPPATLAALQEAAGNGAGIANGPRLALRRSITFASTDHMRPILTHVIIRNGTAYVTDTYRIAAVPLGTHALDGYNLPAKELAKALTTPKRGAVAEVRTTLDAVEITCGARVTTLERLRADAPDLEAFIPAASAAMWTATVARADLVGIATRAGVLHKHAGVIVPVGLAAADGRLTAEQSHSALGRYTEWAPATVSGTPSTVLFNPRFLLDFVNYIEGDTITLRFGCEPATISAEDGAGNRAVLMARR